MGVEVDEHKDMYRPAETDAYSTDSCNEEPGSILVGVGTGHIPADVRPADLEVEYLHFDSVLFPSLCRDGQETACQLCKGYCPSQMGGCADRAETGRGTGQSAEQGTRRWREQTPGIIPLER